MQPDLSSPPAAETLAGSPAHVAAKATVLAMLVGLVIGTFFMLVPEENDYFEAMRSKHERLARLPSPRIVLIGGSNLAFGVDSDLLRRRTGCDVVNMGFNGYLGIRYMLAEAAPLVRRGDIVILAFEYDNYVKTVDGTPADLLMAAKIRPAALRDMTWPQRLAVVRLVPYAVQQKILRILRNVAYVSFRAIVGAGPSPADAGDPDGVDIAKIESLRGFTTAGDLISHLDVRWPDEPEDGLDVTQLPIDTMFVPLIREFSRRMHQRGAHTLVSFTPAMRRYFLRHRPAIDSVYGAMRAFPELAVPSPPETFVFDDSLFFDTVYHLNRQGRELRSERLAHDISVAPTSPPTCGARSSTQPIMP